MPTGVETVARALRKVAERKRAQMDGEPLWKPVMVSDLLSIIGEVADELDASTDHEHT